MEVHHHAHSSRSQSPAGKKWPHYFWEFLMFFFAVFCGFLAEYQLEHTIEHQREKQYAQTQYEDGKTCTAVLNAVLNNNTYITSRIDTFRRLVHTNAINSIPGGSWYYYGKFGTRYFHIAFQDATIDQLKN